MSSNPASWNPPFPGPSSHGSGAHEPAAPVPAGAARNTCGGCSLHCGSFKSHLLTLLCIDLSCLLEHVYHGQPSPALG